MAATQNMSQGAQSALGLSASTVVKAASGRLTRVSVTTAGAAGAVYDTTTTGSVGVANLIGVVPAVVGVYLFDWPCLNGIVYVPGAAQVSSISYE